MLFQEKNKLIIWYMDKQRGISMFKIQEAYWLKALPKEICIKTDNGNFLFSDTPFRFIKKQDLKEYKGHDPEKCKHDKLPNNILRFYGLSK